MVIKAEFYRIAIINKKLRTLLAVILPIILISWQRASYFIPSSSVENIKKAQPFEVDTIDYLSITIDCYSPDDMANLYVELLEDKHVYVELLDIWVDDRIQKGCPDTNNLIEALELLRNRLSKFTIKEIELRWRGSFKNFNTLIRAINMDQLESLDIELYIAESFVLSPLKAPKLKYLTIHSGQQDRGGPRNITIPNN